MGYVLLLLGLVTILRGVRWCQLFTPMNVRDDGTVVFAAPMDDTRPTTLVALSDIGWWARHVFDSPKETGGKLLGMASDVVSWPDIVETFTRVTGKPAVFVKLTVDEYFELFEGADDAMWWVLTLSPLGCIIVMLYS